LAFFFPPGFKNKDLQDFVICDMTSKETTVMLTCELLSLKTGGLIEKRKEEKRREESLHGLEFSKVRANGSTLISSYTYLNMIKALLLLYNPLSQYSLSSYTFLSQTHIPTCLTYSSNITRKTQ